MTRTNKKWITGIYARVSTDHDNQKSSNENQVSALEEWAKNQKNVEIYDTYIDEGISGTSIEKRLAFQRMIRDANNGIINCIVVKSVTRFARNQIDSIRLAKELTEKGVRIYFYQENVDTLDDTKMLGLWAWLAENESRVTSERRAMGGREAQKKGRFTTNRPAMGYYNEDGKLKINKEESHIVERIFNLYVEGNGFAKISSILNEEGYTTRRNFNFRTDKIKYILRNETYVGTLIGNRYKKADMLSKKIIERPREEWVIVEDNHDAIISKELFKKVQDLMDDKSFTIGKRSKSLFAGVTKCGKCGSTYFKTHTTKESNGNKYTYSYYKCSRKVQQGKTVCDNNSIKEEVLIEIVGQELELLKLKPETIEKIKLDTLKKINSRLEAMDSELLTVDKKIAELESQRKTLAKKNITGVIDDDLFIEMDTELKDELGKLNSKKNKSNVLDDKKRVEKNFDDFIETVTQFESIDKLSNVEMRKLIESIVITDDEIEINFKINAEDFAEYSLNYDPIVSTIGIDFRKDKYAVNVAIST